VVTQDKENMLKLFVCLFIALAIVNAQQQFCIYSLSMQTPNTVVIYQGTTNSATITYVKQVPTGGNATGGVQSQSSITVNGNYIFAVNPESNSISMLTINPADPTNVTLVNTISSEGDYPNTITANANSVCVANTGQNSTIVCYSYTAQGLTLLANTLRTLSLNLTTPPVSHTGPGQIAFTPDNTGLIVVVKGRDPPFYLFPVSYTGTTLSLAANPAVSSSGGTTNFDLAFDIDGSFVVVDTNPFSNSTPGANVVNVNTSGAGSINFATPEYLPLFGVGGACWVARSAVNGRFYSSDTGSGIMSEMVRNGSSLSAVNQIMLSNGSNPSDVIIITLSGSDYLFVLDHNKVLLWVFKLGGVGVGGGSQIQQAALNVAISGIAGYIAPLSGISPSPASNPSPSPASNPSPSPQTSSGGGGGGSGGSILSGFVLGILRVIAN